MHKVSSICHNSCVIALFSGTPRRASANAIIARSAREKEPAGSHSKGIGIRFIDDEGTERKEQRTISLSLSSSRARFSLASSETARDAGNYGRSSSGRPTRVKVRVAVDTFTITDWYDRFVVLVGVRASVQVPACRQQRQPDFKCGYPSTEAGGQAANEEAGAQVGR